MCNGFLIFKQNEQDAENVTHAFGDGGCVYR